MSQYSIPWMAASEAFVSGGQGFNLSWGAGCTRSPFCGSMSNQLDITSWTIEYSTNNGSTWSVGTVVGKNNSHRPNGFVNNIIVRPNPQFQPNAVPIWRITGNLSFSAPRGMVSVPLVMGLNGQPAMTTQTPTPNPTNAPTSTPHSTPSPTRTLRANEPTHTPNPTQTPTRTLTGTPRPTSTPESTPMPTATIHPNAPTKVLGLYISTQLTGGNNGLGNVAILKYKIHWSRFSGVPNPVSYYVIQRSDNNGLYWQDILSTQWAATGVDLFVTNNIQTPPGLLFRIRAANSFGNGPWSDPAGWFAANPTSTPRLTNTLIMRTPAPTATPVLTRTPSPTTTPAPTAMRTETPRPTPQPTRTLMPTRAPNATVRPTSTPVPTLRPTETPRPTPLPTRTLPKKFNQALFIDRMGKIFKQRVTPGQKLYFKSSIVLGYAEEGDDSGGDCWVCAQNGPVNIGPISSEKCLSVSGRSTTEQGLDCCQGSTYQTGSWSPSSKSCDLACRNISEICADKVNCGAFRCDQLCSWAIDPCDEPDCYDSCSGAWCEGGCNQGTYGEYRSYVASLPPAFANLVKPFNARYICGGDSTFTLKCPEPTATAPSPTQTPTGSSSSSSPYPSMLKSNHSAVSW